MWTKLKIFIVLTFYIEIQQTGILIVKPLDKKDYKNTGWISTQFTLSSIRNIWDYITTQTDLL